MFESEVVQVPNTTHTMPAADCICQQAAEECEHEKTVYQNELLDTFQRRVKKLEDDLKVLESEGSLDSVKAQVQRQPPSNCV